VERPTPIVWYGAEVRPVDPGRSPAGIAHDLNEFFGGAVLIPNHQFAAINGYSGGYWGWGYEDIDLCRRFASAGIPCGRRKGSFQALDHRHEGYDSDGRATAASETNKLRLEKLWADDDRSPDGLSNLAYRMLSRHRVPEAKPERPAEWHHVKVRLLRPGSGAAAGRVARTAGPTSRSMR
jgi:hypothetical protein